MITPAVAFLLAANAAVFLVQLVADRFVPFTATLGLSPLDVARGHLWQPVTYLFVHGGIWHLLMNSVFLYFAGPSVEAALGTRRFAALYATAGVGAGLVSLAVGWGTPVLVIGASGAIFGVLIAYALLFPYRPVMLLVFFVLPIAMQARWLIAIFAALETMYLLSLGGLAHVAHLSGLVFGWIFLKAPGWREAAARSGRARRVERQMRVVHAAHAEEARLQEEVDALLDKISRTGMAGLTAAEKRRLVEASERLRKL